MSDDAPQANGLQNMPANPHLWEVNWVRDLFVLLLAAIALLVAKWLWEIIQPVLLALLLAYLLNPLVVLIQERWKWSRPVAVLALAASALVVFVGFGLAILPLVISQTVELVRNLPDYADSLTKRAGISDENVLSQLKEKSAMFMKDPLTNLRYLFDGFVSSFGLLSGVLGSATAGLMSLVLLPLYLVFFSWKWPEIASWPQPLIPASRRKRVREIASKMDEAVGGYFRTRVIIALIMGGMYAVGWGIAGVPYWLILGIAGGLLGIIPYAAALAWLAAMLLQFLSLENGIANAADARSVFLWPSLVYGLVQASDDWLLTPWLQGQQLNMSFVIIILAVLIGGSVAGLLGMLLAVPTAACVQIYWTDVLRPALVKYAESH